MKLKVYDIKNKRFGKILSLSLDEENILGAIIDFDDNTESEQMFSDEFKILRFIGQTDKNNKDLYEYDIVDYPFKNTIIKYFDEYSMFGFCKNINDKKPLGHGGSSTKYSPYIINNWYSKRMTKIGNFYEKNNIKPL